MTPAPAPTPEFVAVISTDSSGGPLTPPASSRYRRPDGTSYVKRPDGTSYFLRP